MKKTPVPKSRKLTRVELERTLQDRESECSVLNHQLGAARQQIADMRSHLREMGEQFDVWLRTLGLASRGLQSRLFDAFAEHGMAPDTEIDSPLVERQE